MSDRDVRTDGGRREDDQGDDRTDATDGESVDDERQQPQRDHSQRQGQGRQPRQNQPQQGRGGQPRQNQPRQPRQNQPQQGRGQGRQQPHGQPPQGQPPQRGQPGGYPPGEDDGFTRRQLLIGGAGALAAAGGGWYFFLRDSGGPGAVVEDYVSAINSGDVNEAESLIHEDAPMSGPDGPSEDVDVSVQSTRTVDANVPDAAAYDTVQEFQAVEVEISFSGEVAGQEVGETDTQVVIVAKNTDGEWKLWDT